MRPKLYYIHMSPPVRSVLLTARALDLDLELIEVDVLNGEHFTPQYRKINPLSTVPTLDDDGFILFDSHAICGYLVGKYGKTDALYPRELKARATVDQRLHFDCGILFPKMKRLSFTIVKQGEPPSETQKKSIMQLYDKTEQLIGDNDWVAGPHMTIADFCCVTSILSLQQSFELDVDRFPRLAAWFERCETQMPKFQEINQAGFEMFMKHFGSKL